MLVVPHDMSPDYRDYLPCLLTLGRAPNATRGCQRIRTGRYEAARGEMFPPNQDIALYHNWLKLKTKLIPFLHDLDHAL